MRTNWFTEARYGLLIHYGLYSLLERGEWVWNREEIALDEYKALASRFTAEHFDGELICQMAADAGMRYVVLTTMHLEGFRLYPTDLLDFHIGNSGAAGRDLVAEILAAARKHGLKVGLYHSLNNWYDQPDSVAALEAPAAYEVFTTRKIGVRCELFLSLRKREFEAQHHNNQIDLVILSQYMVSMVCSPCVFKTPRLRR